MYYLLSDVARTYDVLHQICRSPKTSSFASLNHDAQKGHTESILGGDCDMRQLQPLVTIDIEAEDDQAPIVAKSNVVALPLVSVCRSLFREPPSVGVLLQ